MAPKKAELKKEAVKMSPEPETAKEPDFNPQSIKVCLSVCLFLRVVLLELKMTKLNLIQTKNVLFERSHNSPVLKSLHQLPVKYRIQFNILTLTCCSLVMLLHIADLLQPY